MGPRRNEKLRITSTSSQGQGVNQDGREIIRYRQRGFTTPRAQGRVQDFTIFTTERHICTEMNHWFQKRKPTAQKHIRHELKSQRERSDPPRSAPERSHPSQKKPRRRFIQTVREHLIIRESSSTAWQKEKTRNSSQSGLAEAAAAASPSRTETKTTETAKDTATRFQSATPLSSTNPSKIGTVESKT